MGSVERPLSPHLGVYRWQVTNTLSILHRLTGLYLSLGALVLVWWLVALASGPAAYASALDVLASGWFRLPMIGWVFCFFYHLGNGVRHLFWDVGLGFEPGTYRVTGWSVAAASVVATLAYSLAAFI